MVVIPRYEPVFVEPNNKEYEVQVLQMSVNMDDIDNNTATKMDFSRRQRFDPGFNLDSVSYITHDTSISRTHCNLWELVLRRCLFQVQSVKMVNQIVAPLSEQQQWQEGLWSEICQAGSDKLWSMTSKKIKIFNFLMKWYFVRSSDSDSDGALNPTFIGDTGVIRGYNITTSTPR